MCVSCLMASFWTNVSIEMPFDFDLVTLAGLGCGFFTKLPEGDKMGRILSYGFYTKGKRPFHLANWKHCSCYLVMPRLSNLTHVLEFKDHTFCQLLWYH